MKQHWRKLFHCNHKLKFNNNRIIEGNSFYSTLLWIHSNFSDQLLALPQVKPWQQFKKRCSKRRIKTETSNNRWSIVYHSPRLRIHVSTTRKHFFEEKTNIFGQQTLFLLWLQKNLFILATHCRRFGLTLSLTLKANTLIIIIFIRKTNSVKPFWLKKIFSSYKRLMWSMFQYAIR